MPVTVACTWCKKEQSVIPARAKTYKFCSYACRGEWRAAHWVGSNHPRWSGGKRIKECAHCGAAFSPKKTEAISAFKHRKFCSHKCGVLGREERYGPDNPRWKGGKRKRDQRQKPWAQAVISRDKATCTRCGVRDVELHAHHIKSFKEHPELRWDVDNGVTLCASCHWQEHSTAETANAVNSGNTLTDGAEGNPEPSLFGNKQEGVTTRGRAYRRWNGRCGYCGTFLSKRLSDVKGKKNIYCSHSCLGKANQASLRSRQ